MASGVLAAVLLLGGGYYATRPEHRARFPAGPSQPPTASAAASLVPTARPCRDSYRKEIPAAAFVPGGAEICFDPADGYVSVESVPTPCRPAVPPTDALIEDRRGFENIVTEPASDGP